MHVIEVRNVNYAYFHGMKHLTINGVQSTSRNGPVLVADTPVTTVYHKPEERVLFDSRRDANPFFHLMEALWMLAGRRDGAFLDRFVGDFSARYGDDHGNLHGAYGWRWKNHFLNWNDDGSTIDQIKLAIEKLKADPNDRRVVIQMWDPEYDFLSDVSNIKDLPCNLCVLPRIRDADFKQVLDITVMCRSNDAIWGAYGANAVHFSILQEYMAQMIGVEVGKYYQISNNFHAYTNVMDKMWKEEEYLLLDYYREKPFGAKVHPLVTVPESFDEDLEKFFCSSDAFFPELPVRSVYVNSFFDMVAIPMIYAHHFVKNKEFDKALTMLGVERIDWRMAGRDWVHRRKARYEAKQALSEGDDQK